MNDQRKVMLANLLHEKEKRKQRNESFNVSNAYEWIVQNNFVNENGIAMEFADRSFLIEPLCDESKLLAVIKCSQIGFSTISIFKTMYHNIKHGHNVIYTLPTDKDAEDFSKAKTNLILSNNQSVKGFQIDDSLHTKSFKTLDNTNTGFWFMRGTYGQSAAIMMTADILVKDEFDRSNQPVLNQYKSRITASSYGAEWEFSNPTFPSFGVDYTFQLSDQKHYFYWCKCGHPSYITYEPESFDMGNTHHVCKERHEFVCGSCNEIIDRRKSKKEWVPKYTDDKYGISGYWISQMMAPWITASKLIREEQLTRPDVWANFFLGRPYESGSNTLDPSNIIKNIQYDKNGYVMKPQGKYRVLGVDVGGTVDNPHFHCVKGTEEGIEEIIKLQGEEQLHNYMRMKNINMCVLDNAPYPKIGVDLAKAFQGKIWRCVFDYNEKRKEIYETDYKTRIVNVHRTRIFDRVVDGYITGERKVYIDGMDPSLSAMDGGESLCKHWKTQRKVGTSGETKREDSDQKDLKFDRMGEAVPTWINNGADHFSLADIYNQVAQLIIKKFAEGVV
jgi:hypothetical protein